MEKVPEPPINNSLSNAVTPIGGIEFERNMMHFGEHECKVYAVTQWPDKLPIAWASVLASLANIYLAITFEPKQDVDLAKRYSDKINFLQGQVDMMDSQRHALEHMKLQRQLDDANEIMRQIALGGKTVGNMSVYVMAMGKDRDELEQTCRMIESRVASLLCKARVLSNNQQEAFKALCPANLPDAELSRATGRTVPFSTFSEAFPNVSESFIDPTGLPLGRNYGNPASIINLDPWVRKGDRTNSGIVILGRAGMGKSTLAKLLLYNEFCMGTKIALIDPDDEYQSLVEALGGQVIEAGGGSYIINPLQIKNDGTDVKEGAKEEDAEIISVSALSFHMRTLEMFFRLYFPELTTNQILLLKQVLEKTYEAFGIGWQTDPKTLTAADYPTMSDLYAQTQAFRKGQAKDKAADGDLKTIELITRELAEGADQFLWNGHSSVTPETRVMSFNTQRLQDSSLNVKRAQYYNILQFCWSLISQNRKERVMILCDEAHTMIDPRIPESLQELSTMMKRSRKYEGGLMVATQSPEDFLAPAVEQYGSSLLNQPTYKFLLGMDGTDHEMLSKLYNLNQREKDIMGSLMRGVALFTAGSQRMPITIELSDTVKKIMGDRGGR